MASAKRNPGSVGTVYYRSANRAHHRTRIDCKAPQNSVNTPGRTTRQATSRSYIMDTRQPSYLIDDDIEGDDAATSDSEDQPGASKRKLTDDILELADGLSAEAIDTLGQASKRTYNMLGEEDTSFQQPKGSDILIPSTLSGEEERGENSIPFDFPGIAKRSLSLETISQLKKRLKDEETQVEEARSALIEAQLAEFRATVEKCTTERVLGDVERSVRQLQAASHHPAISGAESNQGDAVIDSVFANFRAELEKAIESKTKKEVLSVVLKHKCEVLEASRQSVEGYEHQVKGLRDDLEKRQRAFALRRGLAASLLCTDPEKGVFGKELEFQLRQLDRGLLDTDSAPFSVTI